MYQLSVLTDLMFLNYICYVLQRRKNNILQNTSIMRSFMKKKQIHGQIIYGNTFCRTLFLYIHKAEHSSI